MRARNIKPGYFKNEDLADCDPMARILFAGLWCMADREGRLEHRPKRIKAELLPYDNCNVDKLLKQLSDKEFIQLYSVNNCNYIQILKFRLHQNCHIKEAASTIPTPDLHSASMEVARPITESLLPITESLLPITDSPILNPESTTEAPDKSGSHIPYQEIIEYLNLKTGKNFDHTVKEIRAKIKARSRNGKRTIEDFKKVIDNKCNQWLNDEKMMQFLRPETLFGTKFESYLNETIHPLAGKFSDKTLANIKMFENWRPPNER